MGVMLKRKYYTAMKNKLFLCLFIGLLTACSHRQSSVLLPELVRAESVMYQHPDSALMILEEMPVPSSSDKLQHATWCLLLTQAKYKNYIDQPSDSLIDVAYEYFMKGEDSHRKALVLYLKGVLTEKNDIEKVTQYYLDAAVEVERTDDYQLAHLINKNLGNIYIFRSLYEYAERAYLKSYEYAKRSCNSIYISTSLSHIARTHTVRHNWNEAIRYYQEAIKFGTVPFNNRGLSIALSELSSIYCYASNYDLALQYAKEALVLEKEINISTGTTLLSIGDTYRLKGDIDSAFFYFHQVIDEMSLSSVYSKRSAYQSLYALCKEDRLYIQALEYGDKLLLYNDSIQRISRSEKLIEMQEKYNQEKLLNEKNQLQIDKDETVRTALLGLLFFLFCIALLIFLYQRRLVQKERTIQKNKEEIRLYLFRIHENESLINRNENRMQELCREMEQNKEVQELLEEQQAAVVKIREQNSALYKENQRLQENINRYSTSLREKNRELDTLQELSDKANYLQGRESFLCQELIKRTKVLHELKVSPKYMDVARWEEVKEAIDRLYNDYTKRLLRAIPSLTESDMQICCLVKLRLGVQEIAILLGISPSSVSKRKLRLKDRIIQEGKADFSENQTLDWWLWEY